MGVFRFFTNCIGCRDIRALQNMIDSARAITWKTFRSHVPLEEIKALFPQYSYRKEHHNPDGELTCPFHIKDDWAVSFHRSIFRGRRCYYLRWSAIEFIFLAL